MLIGGIIAAVIGGVLFFFGSRQKKTGEAMQQSRVIPINQATEGAQVEIEGTIVSSTPLQTPYTQRDCVAYEYAVEREERITNAQGVPTTHWQQISSDRKSLPFMVQDTSGSIAVNPDRASLDLQDFGVHIVAPGNTVGNPMFKTVVNVLTNNNTRVREKALMVGSHAYVFGTVVNTANGLSIEKGNSDFVISYKTEAQIEKAKARSAMGMTILGIILGIAGTALIVYTFVK